MAKDLCHGHYVQLWRGRELKALRDSSSPKLCYGPKCVNSAIAYGLCHAHRKQQQLGSGTLRALRKKNHPDGTRKVTTDGYVKIKLPSHPNSNRGWVLEHVLVMSASLGRPVDRENGESVHHKNGDREDNRLENLELWQVGQPGGQRVSDKLEWALDLVRRYCPEKLKE